MRGYSNQKTNTHRYGFLFLFLFLLLFLVWFCCCFCFSIFFFWLFVSFSWLTQDLAPLSWASFSHGKACVKGTVTVRPMYVLSNYRKFLSCLSIRKGFRLSQQLVSNCTSRSRVWVTQVTAAWRWSVSEVYFEGEETQLLYCLLYMLLSLSNFPVLRVDFHCGVIFTCLRL